MGSIMGFLISFVKNDEIRPSISCQIILEWREERNQLNSRKEQLVICSSAFGNKNVKTWITLALHFSSFNPYRPILSVVRGTNRQFYCTGVIIYNKLDNYFVVSADRQTFLGFEMTANLRDTSPLSNHDGNADENVAWKYKFTFLRLLRDYSSLFNLHNVAVLWLQTF